MVSWYPPGQADENGKPLDPLIPLLLDTAHKHGIKVSGVLFVVVQDESKCRFLTGWQRRNILHVCVCVCVCAQECVWVCVCSHMQARTYGVDVCMYVCVGRGWGVGKVVCRFIKGAYRYN